MTVRSYQFFLGKAIYVSSASFVAFTVEAPFVALVKLLVVQNRDSVNRTLGWSIYDDASHTNGIGLTNDVLASGARASYEFERLVMFSGNQLVIAGGITATPPNILASGVLLE